MESRVAVLSIIVEDDAAVSEPGDLLTSPDAETHI